MAKRKRKKHNASNYMPAIEPKPTLNKDKVDQLPRVIVNCSADLSDSDIEKILDRLNFTDHRDLRKLKSIRVVDPDTIKMPSKESTSGCYYREHGSRKAEIWISSELIRNRNRVEPFFNKIFYKDRLFETLFHEIGHHKARLTHSVDKFEDEAYAEKYMRAYRKCWKEHYGPSKIYITVLRAIIKPLRFTIKGFLYPFRNRNKTINLFYHSITGEISTADFTEEIKELSDIKDIESKNTKKKWIHPLRKKKYLDRFKISDR